MFQSSGNTLKIYLIESYSVTVNKHQILNPNSFI